MELFGNQEKERSNQYDLTSEQYFRETFAFVDSHSKHGLPNRAYRSIYANCPFCQTARDSHHLYFGVWCRSGKVHIGCQNPKCGFGTHNGNGRGNNIFDFIIECGEARDLDSALRVWCEYLGLEWRGHKEKRQTRQVSPEDFNQPERGLFFAIFNGKYKHRNRRRISKLKRLLRQQCRLAYHEIQNEVWCRTKEQFNKRRQDWNANYLGQVIYTHLRSFYRKCLRDLEHEPKPLSSLSLRQEDVERVERPVEAAAYRDWCDKENAVSRDKAVARQAIALADERLSDVELRIVRKKCSLRQAQEETDVPFNTIKYRKDKKVKDIRKELGIEVQKIRKVSKKGEKVERKDDKEGAVIYTKIYTAKDYSQRELRELVPSYE